jgi:hypothetical protein
VVGVVQAVPEPSNRDGSILTIYSADGLEFGFIFFARLGNLLKRFLPILLPTACLCIQKPWLRNAERH